VGHVGGYLAEKLHAAGAKLVITDVNPETLNRVAAATKATIVSPGAIFDADVDVFAPCALGGAINLDTLPRIRARVIAGAANNQLADAAAGRDLFQRGILYAPDYVINGGGIINVAGEIRALDRGEAFDPAWVDAKLDHLALTLEEVLDQALHERRPTNEVANQIARSRISGKAPSKAAA
jgi:leucine dehydrogenase